MTSADDARDQAFHALVEGYGRLVAHAVRQVVGRDGASDTDDIYQDVMLALWRRLDRAGRIDHPSSYLYTAAVREAARVTRLYVRRREVPLEWAPGEEPRTVGDADAEAVAATREQLTHVHGALSTLGAERARAVRAYLAGLSVDETMRLYGWSYQKARNLLARGIADLKLRLLRPSPRAAGVTGHRRGWPITS